MDTLIKLGYNKQSNVYVKYIDKYEVSLFPDERGFVRRIVENGALLDIRRVHLDNLEGDKAFENILKNQGVATQKEPTKEVEVERVQKVKLPPPRKKKAPKLSEKWIKEQEKREAEYIKEQSKPTKPVQEVRR